MERASSSSGPAWEEGGRSEVARVDSPVLRRLEGGARWSSGVCVMSTLGREEGTAVLPCSSASLSPDGGSERSDEAGESAMLSI